MSLAQAPTATLAFTSAGVSSIRLAFGFTQPLSTLHLTKSLVLELEYLLLQFSRQPVSDSPHFLEQSMNFLQVLSSTHLVAWDLHLLLSEDKRRQEKREDKRKRRSEHFKKHGVCGLCVRGVCRLT